MKRKYCAESGEDKEQGGYVIPYPELPGYISCGEIVVTNASDIKRAWIKVTIEEGVEIQGPDKERRNTMCNVEKYHKIYEEINKLQPEETLQLMLEAMAKEEKDFFELIGNFLLQKKQRLVIEQDLF